MRRLLAVAVVLVVVVLAAVLAGFGSLSHTDRGDGVRAATPSVPASEKARAHPGQPAPATHNVPPGPPLNTPAAGALRAALGRTLAKAGDRSGVIAFDLDTHTKLAATRDAIKRAPASVEKLWTTATVLRLPGPSARLHTTVLGAGHLRHGVWHGDLYLRGDGDPTFGDSHFNHLYNGGQGPTPAMLVSQLRRHGIHAVTGQVYGDESLFDRRRGGMLTGLNVDIPDFGGQLASLVYDHGTVVPHFDPGTFAAQALAAQMSAEHMSARASRHPRTAPGDARPLATISSPPMAAMLRLMNVPSDDLYAELLAKQLGVRFGHGGTIAAGAGVIGRSIATTYNLHPRILDGSGLSKQNRTSPLEIVDLLSDVFHTPLGDQLAASLPTVGVDGTVQRVGYRSPAARRCIAKTGTLDYVTNLAGYCRTRGGHDVAFALFVDGPDNDEAIMMERDMLAAIARY